MLATKYLLLVCLPAVAYCSITVTIHANKDKDAINTKLTGVDKDLISNEEEETFHLDQETLKKASEIINGKACSNMYFKSPLSNKDLYLENGWNEVERILEPTSVTILNLKTETVELGTASFTNIHTTPANYSRNIEKNVEEYIEHTWTEKPKLSVFRDNKYVVSFGEGSVGGLVALRYESPYGEDQRQNRLVAVSAHQQASFIVPPNSSIVESLYAVEGEVDLEVNYDAKVAGDVYCSYDEKYNGQEAYRIPVEKILDVMNLPSHYKATENIKIGFYVDASVEVRDGPSEK